MPMQRLNALGQDCYFLLFTVLEDTLFYCRMSFLWQLFCDVKGSLKCFSELECNNMCLRIVQCRKSMFLRLCSGLQFERSTQSFLLTSFPSANAPFFTCSLFLMLLACRRWGAKLNTWRPVLKGVNYSKTRVKGRSCWFEIFAKQLNTHSSCAHWALPCWNIPRVWLVWWCSWITTLWSYFCTAPGCCLVVYLHSYCDCVGFLLQPNDV